MIDPKRLPLQAELDRLHRELRSLRDGVVATYIPPLGRADPDWFAVSVVTVDGDRYDVGHSDRRFTIQSVSKPFAFGLALQDLGTEAVLERVGVEPTGDAFNSITVDERNGRPFNPMVNAGAIVTTSLVAGDGPEQRWKRVLDGLGRFAGRTLDVDPVVFEAERDTGDRNRAIAYLMRTFDMLREEVEPAVERYFRQCSVLVDTGDLALMGATLANGGVNPSTGVPAIDGDHVARVLSVMSSCGMYDYAGEWLYRIGLPAKSGVSGAVVAVLPGTMAIACFSPPLDERGNSVRGIKACEHLARRFSLHVFDPRGASPVVRRIFDGAQVHSRRQRPAEQIEVLRAEGARIAVIELQGPLDFPAAEALTRRIAAMPGEVGWLVLDLTRVTAVETGAVPLLVTMIERLGDDGIDVRCAGPRATLLGLSRESVTATLDLALEHCEDSLVAAVGTRAEESGFGDLADQALLAGLEPAALGALRKVVERRVYPAGATVFREGDVGDAIYFVLAGRAGVCWEAAGRRNRLTTVGAGGSFGEMAVVDGKGRSTTVDVEHDLTCDVLTIDALASLDGAASSVAPTLLRNLVVQLSGRLRDANEEIRALRS